MTGAGPRTLVCPRCGALNGVDFDRCIRCNGALSRVATSADRMRSRIDAAALPATKLFAALTTLIFAAQVYVALREQLPPGEPVTLPEFLGAVKGAFGGVTQRAFLQLGGLPLVPEILRVEPWRLLSAVFVHIGILHFGFNMLGLVDLGRIAEPLVGSARLAIAYVVTGIVGFATTLALALVSPQGPGTAGASGALFGIMGVILGFLLRRRDPRWKEFLVRAVVFSLLFGFGLNAMGTGIRINNSAHVGGLLCGVLFGILFGAREQTRSDLVVNVFAAISVVACIASLVLAQLSPLAKQDAWWMFI